MLKEANSAPFNKVVDLAVTGWSNGNQRAESWKEGTTYKKLLSLTRRVMLAQELLTSDTSDGNESATGGGRKREGGTRRVIGNLYPHVIKINK